MPVYPAVKISDVERQPVVVDVASLQVLVFDIPCRRFIYAKLLWSKDADLSTGLSLHGSVGKKFHFFPTWHLSPLFVTFVLFVVKQVLTPLALCRRCLHQAAAYGAKLCRKKGQINSLVLGRPGPRKSTRNFMRRLNLIKEFL